MPYRNRYALIGYYLAVFSLIPCVGVVLALALLPLGLMGLSEAKRNPQARWKGACVDSDTILGTLVLVAHATSWGADAGRTAPAFVEVLIFPARSRQTSESAFAGAWEIG